MSKAKPFLIGALIGAAAVFVALQYHVVRSHDGFQLVPRTPQHSIGLAFADVRGWEAEDWTDRPELARALFAHGSSDLISQSVTQSLAETVTSDSATMDQLRQLLDETPSTRRDENNSFLRLPEASPGNATSDQSGGFTIPFPSEAKRTESDPFRIADAADTAPRTAAPAERSADRFREQSDEFHESRTGSRKSSTQRDAAAVEQLIFGDQPPANVSSRQPVPRSEETEELAPFENVTSELESRARSALLRAQSSLSDSARISAQEAAAGTDRFVRERVNNGTAAMFRKDREPVRQTRDADSLQKLRDNFDPFLQ
jgi:hypothetical protein